MSGRRYARLAITRVVPRARVCELEAGRRGRAALIALAIGCMPLAVHAQPAGGNDEGRVVERQVDFGLGYVDDSSFRYGKYSGVTRQGWHPLLDFTVGSRPEWDSGGTTYWLAEGVDVGLEARTLRLEVGRHGQQRLRLSLNQIPRYRSDSSATPFRDVDSSFLSLPAGWTATGDTTLSLPALGTSLEDLNFRERRRRLALDYERSLENRWHFTANFRQDAKSGRRIMGATMGNTGGNARAALVPAPVDHETDVIDLNLARTEERYSLGLGYSGSFFRNSHTSLTWQNPFGAHPQWAAGAGFPDGLGRMALPPDNSFHQLSLSGAYAFTPNTRGNVSLSYGRMLQDEPFLPFTVNPRLEVAEPLPRSSLDGRIDVMRLTAGVSARPAPRLQLSARYRYEDRDNKTPRDVYRLLQGDAQPQVAAELGRINRPYSLTEHRLAVDASFRLSRRLRLQGGYDYSDVDRDYQEVDGMEEHTLRAGVRVDVLQALALSADYQRARRSVGDYLGARPLAETRVPGTVGPDDFENHPLLRKYYLADRDRDGIRLRGDLPLGATATLGFSGAYHRDDYRNSVFGLNSSTMRSYTLDGGYYPADDLEISAFYTRDYYATDQSGRSFTAAPGQAQDPDRNWWVNERDRFDTTGVTLNVANLDQRWAWLERMAGQGNVDAGVEMVYSRSRGGIGVDAGPALATEPLPDLRTRLHFYRVYADFPLTDAGTLRLALEHERYRTRDFAFEGVEPGTMANVIALGHDSPSYSINWVMLSYVARF